MTGHGTSKARARWACRALFTKIPGSSRPPSKGMSSSNSKKLIIMGSGPAGLTAGIYASRAELSPLILGGAACGGQLMLTTEVGNYPGFTEDILGPDLIQKMIEQAKRFGTEIIYQNADKVDFSSRPFRVWSEGSEYQTKALPSPIPITTAIQDLTA